MEMNQYLDLFIEESKEHLQNCNDLLLKLEQSPEDLFIVNEIFRSAHTLKGMSATMEFNDLAQLTHQMENVLDLIRNEKLAVSSQVLDVLFLAADYLEEMVESIASGGNGQLNVETVVKQLQSLDGKEQLENVNAPETVQFGKLTYDDYEWTVLSQSKGTDYHPYEVTVQLHKDCLLKAVRVFMVFETLEKNGEIIKSHPQATALEEEQFDFEFTVTILSSNTKEEIEMELLKISEIDAVEIIAIDLSQASEEAAVAVEQVVLPTEKEVEVTQQQTSSFKQQSKHATKTIRVNIERLDILMNLFEELVIDRGRLLQISQDLDHQGLQETVEHMSRISGDLQNIILNMRMVPIDTVFNRFPKMVRQLAKDLHKSVNLEIIGAQTELDRTVIDEIGDPLVHLIRNAMDHGIEKPEERLAKGKSQQGTIILKAYHSGNHIFIEITDDGAGINKDNVCRKAISKGIIKEEEIASMEDQDIYQLIFSSGFSTAKEISDVSGRGVGLDVVKSTIESLGGYVTIQSNEGNGSTFSIQLPLTLSIISAMLVEVENEKYAIPLSSIIETAIIKKADIMKTHNQQVIDFRGKVVPLVSLQSIFEVNDESEEIPETLSVVIVRKGEKLAALIVSSFIGQQEIVLKSLGDYLTNVFAISGATILGDGQVALIIDCNELIK